MVAEGWPSWGMISSYPPCGVGWGGLGFIVVVGVVVGLVVVVVVVVVLVVHDIIELLMEVVTPLWCGVGWFGFSRSSSCRSIVVGLVVVVV